MKKPIVVALTVLAALSFGCGKSEKTYTTPGGEVKVKQKSGEVTYEATGKDGEKLTVAAGDKGIALPADFPKDVPIIKGATVKVSMTQGKQLVVHLHVSVPVADAAKFYNDELKAQGWAIESTMNAGDMSMVHAKKGNRQCSVAAAKESDGTLVQLAISQEG
jgi:hypothetical protein